MAKLTRKQKEAYAKIEKDKLYSLEEASALIKEITKTKFDASVDLAVRLGVDPQKSQSNGKRCCNSYHTVQVKMSKFWHWLHLIRLQMLKKLGADYVGLDEYLD